MGHEGLLDTVRAALLLRLSQRERIGLRKEVAHELVVVGDGVAGEMHGDLEGGC